MTHPAGEHQSATPLEVVQEQAIAFDPCPWVYCVDDRIQRRCILPTGHVGPHRHTYMEEPPEGTPDYASADLCARHIVRLRRQYPGEHRDQYAHGEHNLAVAYLALRTEVPDAK